MRHPLRDELGTIISDIQSVKFENIHMNFMHGLGLIAQTSRDISIDGMVCDRSLNAQTWGLRRNPRGSAR